jgi:uncharacterized protein involved in response to NO
LRKSGDVSRDGRGRVMSMPPILQYGFRPFFLAAALYAGLVVPLWLWFFYSGMAPPGPFAGLQWHVHEMVFGYLGAVIAGFILTAVPNWTGRLPLSGWPLAVLISLWLLGRLACALLPNPLLAAILDLSFPAALAFAIWREVVAGKNWRNAPVAAMLTLFGLANAAFHADGLTFVPDGFGTRLALGTAAMLIALIGGRIVPSFTRNWLVKQGIARLPASFGWLDKAALLTTGVAAASWVLAPDATFSGFALFVAGPLLAIRLARWSGLATWREPIVAILHAGYGWLSLALLLLGASVLTSAIPVSSALHALTAGAFGTMTIAVMTRATLGHTGRNIETDRWTAAIYALITLGAALRVAAPFTGDLYLHALVCGGSLWSLGFLLFVAHYGPMLIKPRLTSAA